MKKSKYQQYVHCFLLAYYSLEQNIWRLFHVLAQFLFTLSETKLNYYHQKVSLQESYWNSWNAGHPKVEF